MNARLVAALLAPAFFVVAPAATGQNGTQVRPCPDDPSALCVYGPADFEADARKIRILPEAADADVVIRGGQNDVVIRDGIGMLTTIGDANLIDGGDRDNADEITALGCNSVVKGREGDDRIILDGPDECPGATAVVRAGFGDDVVKNRSNEFAILRGDRHDNRLIGGDGDDRIYGDTEDDVVKGRKGDDRVSAGRGEDRIRGGKGEDDLKGFLDDDVVKGERGRDSVHGHDGEDRVHGNKGRDRLFGGKDDDRLSGGKRADFMDGGFGIDECSGGRGNDVSRRCEM